MGKVHLTGFLICRTLEEADRVSEYLPEHIRLTREEPGCLRFEVLRSQADPVRYAVAESYRDRAAFEAHQARLAPTIWAKITKAIPREYVIREE